jgi:CRP/FNR family transcriptional regulator
MDIDGIFPAPDTVFRKLYALCTVRRVKKSAVMFTQGEAPKEILLLLSGNIALTPEATEPTLCRVAGPGSILGLPANLSGESYCLTAVTVEPCEIAALSREQFVAALRANPEVTLGIVKMLAKELERMQNWGVQMRLAHMDESPSK